jgi:protein-S-isoprenylcysteine O-methyltransferase Ste14
VLTLLQQAAPWVVSLCAAAVLSAVAANFLLARRGGAARAVQRSPVATAAMVAFFIGVYELIHLRLGAVAVPWPALQAVLLGCGLLLVATGAAVNLAGRRALGANWADQATLYEAQQLVTTGMYAVVRHPLYASLCWMFIGAALTFANLAALGATLLVFIPAMYWRAGLEERLLAQAFPQEYALYQRRTGMLFPRLFHRRPAPP